MGFRRTDACGSRIQARDASLVVQTAACACYEAFFQANPGLRVRAQLAELRPPRLPALAACLQPLRLAQQLGHSLAAAVPPDEVLERLAHSKEYKAASRNEYALLKEWLDKLHPGWEARCGLEPIVNQLTGAVEWVQVQEAKGR